MGGESQKDELRLWANCPKCQKLKKNQQLKASR